MNTKVAYRYMQYRNRHAHTHTLDGTLADAFAVCTGASMRRPTDLWASAVTRLRGIQRCSLSISLSLRQSREGSLEMTEEVMVDGEDGHVRFLSRELQRVFA
jgi:hypothetical protein